MKTLHLVARTRGREPLLLDYEFAFRTWIGIQRAFPEAFLIMLMLDHVHLGTEDEDEDGARRRLARCLARAAHGLGDGVWDPVPPPELKDASNTKNFRRFVRYVALNPCRDDLCADPLDWPFSTYRDVHGVTARPGVDVDLLANRLRYERRTFRRQFHRYVSADHKVSPCGTPLLEPAPPRSEPEHSLRQIQFAAVTPLRCPPETIQYPGLARRIFVSLAWHQGWRDSAAIARICDMKPRGARQLTAQRDRVDVQPAALCLVDPRPTRWLTPDPAYAGPRPDPRAEFVPRYGTSGDIGRPTALVVPERGIQGALGRSAGVPSPRTGTGRRRRW